MTRGELDKRIQHVLKLKVTMPALNSLIDKRPDAFGVLLGNSSELAKESHCGKMKRSAFLVKERIFRPVDSIRAKRCIHIAKTSERIEALPTSLSLGTIKSIDQNLIERCYC